MNRATKIIAASLGIFLGLSGLDHGFFEILQGNTPTNGLFIEAIGPDHIMWLHGGEGAFTILPTFLMTGIFAVLVGIALIIWSLFFLDKKYGTWGLIVLTIFLFFFGGGVAAPVVFGPLAWVAASRINKPLRQKPSGFFAKVWRYTLAIAWVSSIIGLFIAITGYIPGISPAEADRILIIDLAIVFIGGWLMFLLSFLSAQADDKSKATTKTL
jgi:hypothetical protein